VGRQNKERKGCNEKRESKERSKNTHRGKLAPVKQKKPLQYRKKKPALTKSLNCGKKKERVRDLGGRKKGSPKKRLGGDESILHLNGRAFKTL